MKAITLVVMKDGVVTQRLTYPTSRHLDLMVRQIAIEALTSKTPADVYFLEGAGEPDEHLAEKPAAYSFPDDLDEYLEEKFPMSMYRQCARGEQEYLQARHKKHVPQVEVDANATVQPVGEGAWVQTWQFVPNEGVQRLYDTALEAMELVRTPQEAWRLLRMLHLDIDHPDVLDALNANPHLSYTDMEHTE